MIVGYWIQEGELYQIQSGASMTDATGEEPWWKVAGYADCTYKVPRLSKGEK